MSVWRIEWLAAHKKPGASWRLPKPMQIRRPGDETPEKKTVSIRDFARQIMTAPRRRGRR